MEQSQFPAKVHALEAISIFDTVSNSAFAPTWKRETFWEGVMTDIVSAGNMFLDGDWLLQLDNTICHHSVEAQHFLLANGVPSILFQPHSSPDFNPIENVWAILKRKSHLYTKHNQAVRSPTLHPSLQATAV